MALETFLKFIRQNYSPEEGQILVHSTQQDPLLWQFVNDQELSLAYYETAAKDINTFSPGNIARWLIEQKHGVLLSNIQAGVVPPEINKDVDQAVLTLFNTSQPPNDLLTAGLLAISLIKHFKQHNNWQGVSEIVFKDRTIKGLANSFKIWRTPFACLLEWCNHYDELTIELTQSESKTTSKASLPVFVHAFLSNPLDKPILIEKLYKIFQHLSIDTQLEGLQWINQLGKIDLQSELANQLIQTRSNRDFLARVFSEVEAFEAVNPQLDPLDKSLRYGLAEDLNRLAAFYHFNGNHAKAMEIYQKSSDFLEFLKAQVRFQILTSETKRVTSSRWLEISKSIPHSKHALQFHIRALIDDQQFDEAQKLIATLPESSEMYYLQSKLMGLDKTDTNFIVQNTIDSEIDRTWRFSDSPNYFVNQTNLIDNSEIRKIIALSENQTQRTQWIDKLLSANFNDAKSLLLACDHYEGIGNHEKAIEYARYLERLDPQNADRKRALVKLLTNSGHWDEAYSFSQELIQLVPDPEIEDLERHAESSLKVNQVEVTLSASQLILKRDSHNKKALVLIGKVYFNKGDLPKAIQHLEKVVKMVPDAHEAWITLGNYWESSGQINRKLETLTNGILANPNQPELLRAYGKAQIEQQALPEALIALQKSYNLDPANQESKFYLATAHFLSGQAQAAYELLIDFIDDYQQNPPAAKLLGKVLIALNKNDLAEPIMLFAAENFPDDHETVNLAVQLVLDRVEQSKDLEVINSLDQIKNLMREHRKGYLPRRQIADIKRLSGQYQEAFDIYTQLGKEEFLDKPSFDWRLNYGLGLSAMGLNDFEVGLAALQMAADEKPESLLIRHALADSLLRADFDGKANECAEVALKLAPKEFDNILWYANFKTKGNQPNDAVQALKESVQISPQQHELKLLLAKSLISAGSTSEAQKTLEDFVNLNTNEVDHLREAAHLCVHLNNIPLAIEALNKAHLQLEQNSPVLIMELSVLYALMQDHNRAIEVLGNDHNQWINNPQFALMRAKLLSSVGQYELAYQTLKIIDQTPLLSGNNLEKGDHQEVSSPLLYMHDFSPSSYYYQLGLLSRALGLFKESQENFAHACKIDSGNLELINLQAESALMDLDFLSALTILGEIDFSNLSSNQFASSFNDLVCLKTEAFLYQDEIKLAEQTLAQLPLDESSSPRLLALKSQLSARNNNIALAEDYLQKAQQVFLQTYTNEEKSSILTKINKINVLNSLAEAYLLLGEFVYASQTWGEITKLFKSQHLLNWRYLYTLITGAEKQRIAEALSVTAHSPGEGFVSAENYELSKRLFEGLSSILPKDQATTLQARMVSAFTGQWPLNISIDAFLQGPEVGAAVLLGIEKIDLANDILDTYPNNPTVLQAYGIFSLRQESKQGLQSIEEDLSIRITGTQEPVDMALLAKLQENTPEKAITSIEGALKHWPDEDKWHHFAADLHRRAGSHKLAQNHISLALDHQPENAEYWQMSALIKVDHNQLDEAKVDLEKSVNYQSENPAIWKKMAEINQRLGDIPTAINNVERASQLDPDDQNLVILEFQLLADQQQFIELEEKARAYLSKNPHHEFAIISLGSALAGQGKYEQALSVFDNTNQMNPYSSRFQLERIKIKEQQLGINPVLPELVTLAELFPDDPGILTTLTDWLIRSNRLEEAEQAAQTILRIIPDQAEIHVMLGRLLRKKGKLDQAVSHLSEAVQLDPWLVEAYIELGKTYQDRRELEKAIETYQLASQANHYDARPYYFAGLALKENKDYQNSEMMLKRAKNLAPDDHNIIRQLGVVSALNLINNLREAKL